jgi:hypothetical protein
MDAKRLLEPQNANSMTTLKELKVQLQGAKITAAGQKPSRRFLPKGSLDDLLNAAQLTSLLQDPSFDIPWHKQEGTADIIITECPKVFGILLELNLERKVVSFIENDLPNKLEYKTVLYYKVLSWYKTVFFGTILVQTSILLYKTVFYR